MRRPLSDHIPGTDKLQTPHVKNSLPHPLDRYLRPHRAVVRLEIPVKADLKHCFREEHIQQIGEAVAASLAERFDVALSRRGCTIYRDGNDEQIIPGQRKFKLLANGIVGVAEPGLADCYQSLLIMTTTARACSRTGFVLTLQSSPP